MKYIARVTKMTIAPENEAIFHELATSIEICDEAAGEFLEIHQCNNDSKNGTVAINPDEWPIIREVIQTMLESLRKDD